MVSRDPDRDVENRLTGLEIRYSHQEKTLQELEKVCFDQHRTIENLRKYVEQLSGRLEAIASPETGPGDQKPPHY